MVNFTINDLSLPLSSSLKSYTLAQDKAIDPKVTYKRAVRALDRCFSEKGASLKVIKEVAPIFVYDYGDESLNMHGKGMTKDQAMASAVMEYLERVSYLNFDYLGDKGYNLSSYNDMKRNFDIGFMESIFDVVYVEDKDKYSSIIKGIPMHWVSGFSLTNNSEVPYPLNWNNLYQTSNGLAAGNTREEAICQGICEVIERHNIGAITLPDMKVKTELINNDSIENELVEQFIKYLNGVGIDVYIFNVVYDVEIPTIMACCVDHNPPNENLSIGCGYGTHPDPVKAIIRAITEYIQFREGMLVPGASDISFNTKKGNWQYKFEIDYQELINNSPRVDCSSLPNLSSIDIRDEIYSIIDVLRKSNYEVIVIDKTHPGMKIPVVRIFIPDMLPGCLFMSADQNVHSLITQLYYQGGEESMAQDYFEEHFDSIIVKQFDSLNDLIDLGGLPVDFGMLRQFVTPSVVTLDSIYRKDYRESWLASLNTFKETKKRFGL